MNLDSVNINSVKSDGKRRAQQRVQTHDALVAAARHLFAINGIAETGIAAITAAAGVSVGTFYVHFRDKEELVVLLLDETLARLRQAVRGVVLSVPPAARLPAIVRAICRLAEAEREVFLVGFAGRQLRQGYESRVLLAQLLTQHFAAAQEQGVRAGAAPDLLANMVTGAIAQALVWQLAQEAPDPDETARQIIHFLRAGLPSALLADADRTAG
jgi:AcrR family transcriptional regulator